MNEISSMILNQEIVFILNCFLSLLLSYEMIDDFLHYYWFIFVIEIDISCQFYHVNSFWLFIEVFVLELCWDENFLVQSCRYSCFLAYWLACRWFIYRFLEFVHYRFLQQNLRVDHVWPRFFRIRIWICIFYHWRYR